MDDRIKQKSLKSDLPHNIIMENRSKISVSGVENAESYNENEVVLCTSKGILIIRGECLGLSKLSLDSGEITVNGHISTLEYVEPKKSGTSFLSKLFK